MSMIVAGVFDTAAAADRAAQQLQSAGFGDLDRFVLSPPGRHHQIPTGGDEHADPEARHGGGGALTGAAIGSAIGVIAGLAATPLVGPVGVAGGLATGAYVGSMAGAVGSMGADADAADSPALRPAGVMVAVNTGMKPEDVAVALLRESGANMIERASGTWADGHWTDFDPVRPPEIVEQRAA